jgi:hypothetical protein
MSLRGVPKNRDDEAIFIIASKTRLLRCARNDKVYPRFREDKLLEVALNMEKARR